MKKITAILIAVLAIVLLLTACADRKDSGSKAAVESSASMETAAPTASPHPVGYRQISQEEAQQIMQTEKDYLILDVRTQEEYDEGHIPAAICIPLDTITDADIPELPDKDQLILVYCRSGRRSKLAAEQLVKNGYTDIVEFGGIIDWTGEVITES